MTWDRKTERRERFNRKKSRKKKGYVDDNNGERRRTRLPRDKDKL
jgi:hypothetical protein